MNRRLINLPGLAGGTSNNLNNVVQNYTHGDQGDVKIDWAPTERDRVFARYSQQHITNPILNSEVFQYSGAGDPDTLEIITFGGRNSLW